jgi:hypothetical protein
VKEHEIRVFVYTTAAVVALIWLAIVLQTRAEVVSQPSLRAFNLAIVVALAGWTGYFSFAWKWPVARRLLYRPNINGTWLGEFRSDWVDANGVGVPPARFVLVVRQRFFSMAIHAYSERLTTISYVESLIVEENRGTKQVAYLFEERRAAPGHQGARQGAAELDLIDEANARLLQGDFWTHAGTTGFVRVKQVSKGLHTESLQDALGRWSDSRHWASVASAPG